LNLQETIGLLIGKTEFVATSQANIVKTALLSARRDAAKTASVKVEEINVDSPVPYTIERFIYHVRNSTDMPTQASKQDSWNSILNKIEVLKNDSRLAFMMKEWDETADPLPNIVGQFIGDSDPIRIVDLSGVPNEVAGAASSAIARTLFSVKLWQTREEREKNPVLLVCEEAHRYVPNRGEAQYEAAQDAIRRLAKEGRKYGI
jgi:DNA helicase HerA-like ATPase